MLVLASLCLIAVSAMHSVLGGRRLIEPICNLPDLPAILGSRRNTVLTLKFGWHFLSAFWLALAVLLLRLHFAGTGFTFWFLVVFSTLFAVCGVVALVASRGRHLSWALFFPVAILLAIVAAVTGPGA